MGFKEIRKKHPYYKVNREERNLVAFFYHVLLSNNNLEKFIKKIAPECPIVIEEAAVYFEYAYLRDLWHTLTNENEKKELILSNLNVTNKTKINDLNPEQFNQFFGAKSKTKIESPSNWSIGRIDQFNNDLKGNDFLEICKLKWCFNSKADLVIHTDENTAFCFEAKLESGIGKYPTSAQEIKLLRERLDKKEVHVDQIEIQKKMMNLLGIKSQHFLLCPKPRNNNEENSYREISWFEAFSDLDLPTVNKFLKEGKYIGDFLKTN
jgi:hypothetical protein